MKYSLSAKVERYQLSVGVFAIILDDRERVLLGHRTDYDFWNLPGGQLEQGETPWEGVIREVKEETGLEVKVDKLIGVYSKPEKNDLVLQFKCSMIGGKLAANDEADRLEYFESGALPKNTSPKQAERIRNYFADPDAVALQKQTGKSTVELIKEGKL